MHSVPSAAQRLQGEERLWYGWPLWQVRDSRGLLCHVRLATFSAALNVNGRR
jgi:hypothetical protein